MRHLIVAALIVLAVATPATMRRQSPLERIIGPAPDGTDIVVQHYSPTWDSHWVRDLAAGARVTMGIEVSTVTPKERPAPLKVTGLTLERALRELHARDPRYEWRDDGGVVVLRPAESRDDDSSPLHLPAIAVRAERLTMNHAYALVCRLLGARSESLLPFSDTKPFSLNFAGGSIADLLTAIVRSHGEMSWSFSRGGLTAKAAAFYFISFHDRTNGIGCGVPGVLTSVTNDPFLRRLFVAAPPPVLIDQVVGLLPYNSRVTAMTGLLPVDDLFRATLVPFGFERGRGLAPPGSCGTPGGDCSRGRSVVLSGKTLGQALDALIGLNPRYEWREMSGIVVVRPASAWSDSDHPLYKPFAGVRLDSVPTSDVMRTLAIALGSPGRGLFNDSRPLTLDVPPGTILDLMNAITVAHGELMWSFGPEPEPARRAGARFVINFFGPGGAQVAAMSVP